MNRNMPRTPFSTALSGSARETEIRIRNLFSGPKKRPPLPLMALTVLMILLCGNLVSCHQRPAAPTVVMETQHYDRYGNYVEIPALTLPAGAQNEAVDAINAGLNELRERYANAANNVRGGDMCLFYPSTTDRYLNLLFYEGSADYGNDGYVCSWVYDWKEGVQVTEEDAFALAGTTKEAMFADLEAFVAADPEDPRELYKLFDPINLQGFRIKADGKPVFYLTAVVDGRGLEDGGYLDEWSRLYVWEDGTFTRYYCMAFWGDGQYPLIPTEETDRFDPPLWNQWYFSGEEPEYSPAPATSQAAADLRAVLLGSKMFTDVETGLVLDVTRVTEAVTDEADFTAVPTRFACVDMDRDETNEVVVWLTAQEQEDDLPLAFLVLRWQEEGVYNYTRYPRSLQDLKQDGAFLFSSSAADYGVGYAQFVPNERGSGPDIWETLILLEQSRVDGDWDKPIWSYGGDSTLTEEDFNNLYQEQFSKENARWYDFTPELIEQMID